MNDIRYSIRTLAKNPAFTIAAVATLALALGANTAIFTLIDSVLLRPLSYHEPERLAELQLTNTNDHGEQNVMPWPYPRFEDLKRLNRSYESLAAHSTLTVNLGGSAEPQLDRAEFASATYFQILGVQPALGRTFTEEEDRTPHAVAVISDALWRTQFAGDRRILGRAVRVNETPFTVIGVMPSDFSGIAVSAALWAPMSMAPEVFDNPEQLTASNRYWTRIVGRLSPGVTLAQANEMTRSVFGDLRGSHQFPRFPSKMRHGCTCRFRTRHAN